MSRDRFICQMAEKYPEYGFEKHKGYGTKANGLFLKIRSVSDTQKNIFKKIIGRMIMTTKEIGDFGERQQRIILLKWIT